MKDIEIGDTIKLNKKFLKLQTESFQKDLQKKLEIHGTVVRSITPCNSNCDGCPGNVNGQCWGYSGSYLLEVETNKFEGKYSF